MTDPVPDSKPPTRWLWVALIVLLAVAAVIVFLDPGGDAEEEVARTAEDDSSSLIVTEPAPGAVPVDIPGGPESPTVPSGEAAAEETTPGQ